MISTFCNVNFDRPLFSARVNWCLGLKWILPLMAASAMLSAVVPSIKWSGFTHGGLSHLCMTSRLVGTGPNRNSHEARDAIMGVLPTTITPYPLWFSVPVQIQQEPSMRVFLKKRLCRVLRFTLRGGEKDSRFNKDSMCFSISFLAIAASYRETAVAFQSCSL